MPRMNLLPDVLRVLDHSLSLKGRALAFQGNTRLLGDLPELDSMAVLAFIEGLESHFGVTFSDDSITSDSFATVDSVCALVQSAIDEQGT
jgi:acyl carrier protein